MQRPKDHPHCRGRLPAELVKSKLMKLNTLTLSLSLTVSAKTPRNTEHQKIPAGRSAGLCRRFILGTQTIFNVLIAMLFRIVVALLYAVLGKTKIFYLLSGPVASSAARLALSLFIGKAVYPLLAAALPGMIFTALTSGLFASVLEKTLNMTKRVYERS